MRYEILTLTLKLGAAGTVTGGLDRFVRDDKARGTLLGNWISEIGELNRMFVLRSFADDADMHCERMRLTGDPDPLGAGDGIVNLHFEGYMPFPWVPPVQQGTFGPVYEIRTYMLKHGGYQPTSDAWQAAMPARSKLSPMAVLLYGLEGTPRITHIWPFASLDDRQEKRALAVAQGVWPPKAAPQWLTGEMLSTIALPTSISPLK